MLLLRSLPKKTKYRHGKTTYRHAKTWRYIVYDIISQEMEGIRMITYKVYSDIGNREKNEDSVGNFHVIREIYLYWLMDSAVMDVVKLLLQRR